MEKRHFRLNESSQEWGLSDKCREIVGKYDDICVLESRDNYILECYRLVNDKPDECVQKLFFERTSSQILQRFKSVSIEKGFESFLETYLTIGRYGVKSFTNALKNGLIFVK